MSRYLVVAHETVTNPELLAQVRSLIRRDRQAEFVLLVPATPVRHLMFRREKAGEAQAVARKLADKARTMFERRGVNLVEVLVGPESPIEAIEEEVTANPDYAGFVISTLPQETSRWVRMNLPQAVESKYGRPVYHVQASPYWSAADRS